jgi:hypothetical protein
MGATHVISDRPWVNGEPAQALETAIGEEVEPVVRLYRLPDALGRVWIVPTARQVAPDAMLAALTDPAFDPTAEALLEYPVSSIECPMASIEYWTALQDIPNGVRIRTNLHAPGYLVLADIWYPGWQAWVDGEQVELLRANHTFRAVPLDSGDHVIDMRYRPLAVRVGVWVSSGALVIAIVVALVQCVQDSGPWF